VGASKHFSSGMCIAVAKANAPILFGLLQRNYAAALALDTTAQADAIFAANDHSTPQVAA
jgi:hypothetical protein